MEARKALLAEPEGPPLIFLAPKQATFQLERQLLADPALAGYTRLRILSFERLAEFALDQLGRPTRRLLSEQGRVMALRAILARRQGDLRIFRADAGFARFAGHLSDELRAWQRRQYSSASLLQLSERREFPEAVRRKLHDLGLVLGDYMSWLEKHQAQDPDCLLALAAETLEQTPAGGFPVTALWMDGFAEMSAGEFALLTAVARRCDKLTLAFCVDPDPAAASASFLSIWAGVEETRRECWMRLGRIPGIERVEEKLAADDNAARFAGNPALAHLERHWTTPKARTAESASAIRAVVCPTPEMEAVFAAREICRFVRERGGRYREAAVLVRAMEGYGDHLRRVFARYEIPFFLDRREPASHHPLAELTRAALRGAAFDWRHEEWFGALKTGLVWPDLEAVDRLENEALARGWKGETWFYPLPGDNDTAASAERLRQRIIGPFARFRGRMNLGQLLPPTGTELAEALRRLWRDLRVEKTLQKWSQDEQIHATVWEQMNALLDDLDKAFGSEALPLREWAAILEAALTGLTVGVIPPALDQVLIGAIDRSRNPELRLALVLGLNETIFPAPPRAQSLFSESDRDALRQADLPVGPTRLQLLGREQFLAYIACTRARENLLFTWARAGGNGASLNPSPLVSHLKRLFPNAEPEVFSGPDWRRPEHPCELFDRLVETHPSPPPRLESFFSAPAFASWRAPWRSAAPEAADVAGLAQQLYGTILKTSVSRLEDHAACAFKFFVHSGLRAEERRVFELDLRERGSFLHAALARFHHELAAEGKRWRDLAPPEGRATMRRIVETLATDFREGLLASNPVARFSARTAAETLGNFVATTIEWMEQYQFDPCAVELSFGGENGALPAWEIDLGGGRRLIFRGIIDRIDLWRPPGAETAFAVVMDYKSGAKKLEDILMAHGLQLQLAAYLAALRRLPLPSEIFGTAPLIPAGMFYVSLRGRAQSAATRDDAARDSQAARQAAFRHFGRFNADCLDGLDRSGAQKGAQFNFKLTRKNQINRTLPDALTAAEFARLLDEVEGQLRRMGQEIYAGAIQPNPFQKGLDETACQRCQCQAICRFDPWTDSFRHLTRAARHNAADPPSEDSTQGAIELSNPNH